MVMLLQRKLPRRKSCQFPKLGAGLDEKVRLFLKKKDKGRELVSHFDTWNCVYLSLESGHTRLERAI